MAQHFLDKLEEDRAFDLIEASDAISLLRKQIVRRSHDCSESTPRIVGQEKLVDGMLMALILGEHCLIEGSPGLVKTEASKTLADMSGLVFRRIQFTPDMLPSDLISRERLELTKGVAAMIWEPGPIFTNVLLADEINRASSKLQSALLEATEERQVTTLYRQKMLIRPKPPLDLDEETLLKDFGPFFGATACDRKPQQFMVLATMNPIEQEGVYPLSEAQVDRFAFKLVVDYPPGSDLAEISKHAFEHPRPASDVSDSRNRDHVKTLYFFSSLRNMLVGQAARDRWLTNQQLRPKCEILVNFTHLRSLSRHPVDGEGPTFAWAPPSGVKQDELCALLAQWRSSTDPELKSRGERILAWSNEESYPEVLSGASPRGLLKLVRAIHARAFLRGGFSKQQANPKWQDVCAVAPEVLRHRIRISSASLSTGGGTDNFISELLRWLEK